MLICLPDTERNGGGLRAGQRAQKLSGTSIVEDQGPTVKNLEKHKAGKNKINYFLAKRRGEAFWTGEMGHSKLSGYLMKPECTKWTWNYLLGLRYPSGQASKGPLITGQITLKIIQGLGLSSLK